MEKFWNLAQIRMQWHCIKSYVNNIFFITKTEFIAFTDAHVLCQNSRILGLWNWPKFNYLTLSHLIYFYTVIYYISNYCLFGGCLIVFLPAPLVGVKVLHQRLHISLDSTPSRGMYFDTELLWLKLCILPITTEIIGYF